MRYPSTVDISDGVGEAIANDVKHEQRNTLTATGLSTNHVTSFFCQPCGTRPGPDRTATRSLASAPEGRHDKGAAGS
jgi:hypothetical protein